MKHKILTLLLAIVASTSTLFAVNGTCGDNLTWDLTDGVLTISGTGAMKNYSTNDTNRAPWYSFRTSITSVSIGGGVTRIGNYAFYLCSKVTSIIIPNSVTAIGQYAFYGCRQAISVIIPNSVTSIGQYAFYVVPNVIYSGTASGTPWNARSVNGYVEGKMVYSDDTKTSLLACIETKGEIILPNGVTSIGNFAFYYCDSLTSITIPSTVTSIGESAFMGCTSLTSITIPNNTTSIGQYAFYACTSLNAVIIPDSVKSIGQYAFYKCKSLKAITIPESVTSIEKCAFDSCYNLTSIFWKARNCTITGNPFGGQVESFIFGNEVTTIPSALCQNMDKLTSITIPNSVTTIGSNAFSGCNSLPVVDNIRYADTYLIEAVDKALSSYTIKDGTKWIGISAFQGCTSLTSVVIPNSVISIGTSAFNGCRSLFSIAIPNSIISIDPYAFNGCSSLDSFEIPNSVTSIRNNTFQGCSGLTSIIIPNSVTSISVCAFNNCSGLTSIIIPNSVTTISACAFNGCSSLTSVEIPHSVTSIGYGAFKNCTNLVTVELSNNIKSIQDSLFYGCSSLSDISIPENVTSIGAYAFYKCEGLTAMEIPSSVTKIGKYAFAYCSGIVSLDVPSTVTSIGDEAFIKVQNVNRETSGWTLKNGVFTHKSSAVGEYGKVGSAPWYKFRESIKKIVFEQAITKIGDGAFIDLINLEEMHLPSSCKALGYSVFGGCVKLASTIIIPDGCSLKEAVFGGCSSITDIKFAGVAWMGGFNFQGTGIETIELPNNITSIPKQTFYNCSKLKSINIGSNINTIGRYAFGNCESLTSLDIPENVTTIDECAFSGCTNLQSINLPSGITKINQRTFYGCSSLENIEIPHGITEIGYETFMNCKKIKFILLTDTVNRIQSRAFRYCSNLTICVHASTTIGISSNEGPFTGCKKVIYYTDRMGDYWFNDTILTGYTGTETDLHLPATHNGAPYVIGASAFANLEAKITSVHIPSSVTSIKANAFKGCRTLKSVILPADLTDIATTAFANCDSISSVTMGMHAETPSLKTLFASSKNKTLKELTLQQGSTIMGTKKGGNNYLVFANDTVLESIKIPYTAKIVADSAFMNCKHLRSITIGSFSAEGDEPENMPKRMRKGNGINPDEIVADIHVGVSTFEGDTEARYITWMYIKNIAGKAFKGCTGLTECIIPNTVTNIDYEAFANCTGLKVVKIPSSVTSIQNYAFSGCSNIEDLTIECNPAAFIPSGSSNGFQFSGCNHIRKLKYNSYIDSNHNIPALTTLFASSLSTIEELEFLSGSDEVYWTSRLPSASDDLILGMPSLKSVILPEGVEILNLGAFKGCASLEKIDLPNSLTKIKNMAFMNSGLNSIILPMNISSIEGRVLTNCPNLQKVEIGCVDLDTIPESLCADCPNLNEVNYLYYGKAHCLPTVISAYAFSNCTSLCVISIPESVEVINEEAYNNCIGAKQLVVESFEPPVCYYDSHYPFNNVNRDHTLWIPKGSVESYRTAEVWKTFINNYDYNWEATMLQREQQIKAEIEKDNAIISWAEEENAGSYDFALNEVGTESSPRTFTIPTYTAENNAPAFAPRKIISEEVPGIKFSVSGLKLQTTYYYTITARDEARNVLRSYAGSFTTDATVDVKVVNSGTSSESKILRNGQVVIQKGDKTYTLTGQEVK